MLSSQSIVCFAGEDWWYHHPHSRNHIMKILARHDNRVLFVNSISMGAPGPGSPDFWSRAWAKLKSMARWVRTVEPNLIVHSPIVIPYYGSAAMRFINDLLLTFQVRLVMRLYGLIRPVVWMTMPTAAGLIGKLNEKVLVYQVADKYEAHPFVNVEVVRRGHEELLRRADVVLFAGRRLFIEERHKNPRSCWLPHAADFPHWSAVGKSECEAQLPEDVRGIEGPVLGFFGRIDHVTDVNLISEVARRRPDWHWVILGRPTREAECLAGFSNVHLLGMKPFSELTRYVKRFDVCVLPLCYRKPYVVYRSAIKVREYLATGKPVVMSPIFEYEPYRDLLRFAADADEFVAQVADALTNDTVEMGRARQDVVRNDSWSARAEQFSRWVTEFMDSKRTRKAA